MKLVVATRNPGKLKEIKAGLAGLEIELRSLADFPDAPEIIEDGATFAANAVKKAQALCAFTGWPALADDSGLEVDALRGAPGVRSARFAGEGATDERNNAKLLALLHNVPPDRRAARFVCVLALAWPDGKIETVVGRAEGRILDVPRGTRGFGYDPLFFSPELGASFAEAGPEQKLRVSHRGQALAELRRVLVRAAEAKD